MKDKISNNALGVIFVCLIVLLMGLAIGYAVGYRMGYNVSIRDSGISPAVKTAEEMNGSLDLLPTPPGKAASPESGMQNPASATPKK